MAHSSSSLSFPADVLYLRGDPFFNFVRQQCGEIVVEVLQMQAINSVHSLLSMDDHFSFFELNSDDLIALRRKVGMTLTDGSFKVKPGVRLQLENLVRSLRELFPTDQHRSSAADLVISAALLDDYAFLRPLIDFCQNGFQNFDASSDSNMKLLPFFLQTLLTNIAQSDSRNRYSDELKSFALCLYIFAGHNAYEFVRLNIPGALPNSTSIKTYLASSDERLSEGAYRYDAMARHMSLMNSKFAFCAEDCTAVVRKIHYNSHANTFVGFVPDFRNGFPVETCYSTESFDELQSWYAERDMSALLSVNVIQPLLVNSSSSASYILSAYGTNAHYTAFDILRRWIEIVEQSSKRNIRVVGFSSDCDPKFLKAMRLALGFFVHVPNISIEKYPNTFAVDVPTEWGWFFLRGRQLFVCMQDSVHLCTKLRNRLLSPKVTLLLGRQRVSVQYLYELIENSSKLNHRLVRSDISPKDRQNYDSCEKISSDDVLRELEQIQNSEATLLYLKVNSIYSIEGITTEAKPELA